MHTSNRHTTVTVTTYTVLKEATYTEVDTQINTMYVLNE